MERLPSWRIAAIVLAALVAAVLFTSRASFAGNDLEKLLMPGPVIAGHAKIENDCNACHKPFSKEAQDSLCLDCHKPIAADIRKKTGFHGKTPLRKGLMCNACHDDHLGRDADIVQLDPALFDHETTDFALTGGHRESACRSCHAPEKRWAEAPSTCFACHGASEPHRGALGKDCQSCHRTSSWRDTAPFDHGRTKFRLAGKHQQVPCMACHVGEVYAGLTKACDGCHAIQDVHRRKFGTACGSCHNETSWKETKFDHGRDTKFPLAGAHGNAKCQACHGASVLVPVPVACADCHKSQDVHRARLGPDCGTCHNATAWRRDVKFDHGLSKFPLVGLHAAVACESCHEDRSFRSAGLACKDCHSKDDVHAGRLTPRCETCHTANGWQRVAFDHDRQTKFTLTGRHAKIGCYDCHTRKAVADARLSTTCYSCHAKQDVHRGKFGTNCASCHGTSNFTTAFIRRK